MKNAFAAFPDEPVGASNTLFSTTQFEARFRPESPVRNTSITLHDQKWLRVNVIF